MTHSRRIVLQTNVTSLSSLALERSIEDEHCSLPKNKSQSSVQAQILNKRTKGVAGDDENFEGMGAPLHQPHCQRGIFLLIPRQAELPEMDTAR